MPPRGDVKKPKEKKKGNAGGGGSKNKAASPGKPKDAKKAGSGGGGLDPKEKSPDPEEEWLWIRGDEEEGTTEPGFQELSEARRRKARWRSSKGARSKVSARGRRGST